MLPHQQFHQPYLSFGRRLTTHVDFLLYHLPALSCAREQGSSSGRRPTPASLDPAARAHWSSPVGPASLCRVWRAVEPSCLGVIGISDLSVGAPEPASIPPTAQ